MSQLLYHMMAEFESWEAAAEFNIPQQDLAEYVVKDRVDDLYIATLSYVFDNLRDGAESTPETFLSAAKTLLVFSKSSAAKYLNGVEKNRNLLYASSLYYLADQAPTSYLVSKDISPELFTCPSEIFLYSFLSKSHYYSTDFTDGLFNAVANGNFEYVGELIDSFIELVQAGKKYDPIQFIASMFAAKCLMRFSMVNVWKVLSENSDCEKNTDWNKLFVDSNDFPIWELLPSQVSAIESGILVGQSEAYTMQMPTSAGKTALCEIIIFHEVIVRQKKVLFLVPFRALAAEVKEGMYVRLENAGISIVASYGGNLPTRSESASVENADVLISTPEKFEALSQVIPDFFNRFDVVLCDEGHLIDDVGRGLQYELLLTKLRLLEDSIDKIIFISAILPNVSDINEWLGGDQASLIQSDYHPVVSDCSFVRDVNGNLYLDFNPHLDQPQSFFLKDFIKKDELKFFNEETNRLNLLPGWNTQLVRSCASAFKAAMSGSVALFATERGGNGVAGLANKALLMLDKQITVADSFRQNIPDQKLVEYLDFQLGNQHLLSKLVNHCIGYHHGQLPQEIRREMEEGLGSGKVKILICTSTLAEGVNLPIRTLVVHTIKRYDGNRQNYIQKRSIKNIIGRAGRAGKETRGRIIFANNSERNYALEVIKEDGLESAYGTLFRLVKALNDYLNENNIQLSADFFDSDVAKSIDYIVDNIDSTLMQTLPDDLEAEQVNAFLDQMLSQTLASKFCDEDALADLLKQVFSLRAQKVYNDVAPEVRQLLRATGSSLSFWEYVDKSKILENEIWKTLDNPLDPQWMGGIVGPVLTEIDPEVDVGTAIQFVDGWLKGLTYIEIANNVQLDVDEVIDMSCNLISFNLQQFISQLVRLASELYSDELSEVALSWPMFIQYGLSHSIQLQMVNAGLTDRLSVWGSFRFIENNTDPDELKDSIRFLRDQNEDLIAFLGASERVPALSVERLTSELKL